jgi:hypothetical protein
MALAELPGRRPTQEARAPPLSTIITIARGLRVDVGGLLSGVESLTGGGNRGRNRVARILETITREDQVALRRIRQ